MKPKNSHERHNSAIYLYSTKTPLNDCVHSCGNEDDENEIEDEDVDNELPSSFKFSNIDNFFENLDKQLGVPRNSFEVEPVALEPGMVRLSYPSDGECRYEKAKPAFMVNLYYRIYTPAEDWKLAQLLEGGNCSNLYLRMEHLYEIVCPLEGDGEEEVVADDKQLSGCDYSDIVELQEAECYAGCGNLANEPTLKVVAVEGDPGVLRFDYHGTETGDTIHGIPTHSCSLYVRIMSPVYADEMEEWFDE